MKAPEGIANNALVLMADIWPTSVSNLSYPWSQLTGSRGCFAADNAFKELSKEEVADATVVLIGCG